MAIMRIESIAGKLKEIIDRNGSSYLTDEPYKVYLELLNNSVADRNTAATIHDLFCQTASGLP